jgi:hypothetical protein
MASPMARLQTKNAGGSHHRINRIIRHSLRKGLSEAENACAINGIGLRCTPLCPAELLEWAAWPPVRWRGLPGVPVALRWRRAVRPSNGLDADACRLSPS